MATTRRPGSRKPRPSAAAPDTVPAAPAPPGVAPAASAARPRRLERSGGTRRSAPSARSFVPASGTVALEDVLVGFQRSLARATRSSLETSRADWQVGLGQRSLYVVDSIGVTLQAGVIAALDPDGQVQSLSLDLGQTEGPGASTLEFRVQARPIEAIAGEQLTLADVDPLGHARPRHRMRFTLIGRHDGGGAAVTRPTRAAPPEELAAARARGIRAGPEEGVSLEVPQTAPTWVPLAGCDLEVHLVGGDSGKTETFLLRTNLAGQADLEIDPGANRIEFGGARAALKLLDLREHDDDFFVFARCRPQGSEGGIVSGHLTSNVVQFRVVRERAAPAKRGRR
jgi:hypothetical protein